MGVAFPRESVEYRAARDRLLEQEVDLRRAMEAVAAARRRLPPGGVVPQDYVFHTQEPGGDPAEVRLSELFAPGNNSLGCFPAPQTTSSAPSASRSPSAASPEPDPDPDPGNQHPGRLTIHLHHRRAKEPAPPALPHARLRSHSGSEDTR
jgi:hypothetical protein